MRQQSVEGVGPSEKKEKVFAMHVPNDGTLAPSTHGGLVKVTYRLEVTGDVTCANSPRMKVRAL